ncbi:MAG TPA: deoxyguanosinetriphosphate triphosphohydrolase, partial [Giesbergeria sp.]|nr:deoxyguanosinetriphosphate triphosphohydrolase [Giesbergeria sp.]
GGVGARFLLRQQPSLEAQLCNLADEIAYNAHDIDDGVRSGLISMEQLQSIPLFESHRLQALAEHPALARLESQRRLLYEAIRRMLSAQVYDVIEATRHALQTQGPKHVDEVRAMPVLVRFSEEMHGQSLELKRFLFANLYRHPQVVETTNSARQVVRDLFASYMQQPQAMKPIFAQRWDEAVAPSDRARVVADFIAGMTDRYAVKEHERLTGQRLLG